MVESHVCDICGKPIRTITSLYTFIESDEIKSYHRGCYEYITGYEKLAADKEKRIRDSDIYYSELFILSRGMYECIECGCKCDSLHHAALHFKTAHKKLLRKYINDKYIILKYNSFYNRSIEAECLICGFSNHRPSIKAHVFNIHFRGGETKSCDFEEFGMVRFNKKKVALRKYKLEKCLNFRKQIRNLIILNEIILKPWKDPESLFCDTDFLNELGLDVRSGSECRGV